MKHNNPSYGTASIPGSVTPMVQPVLFQTPNGDTQDVASLADRLIQLKRKRPKNHDEFREQQRAIETLCTQAMQMIQDTRSEQYLQFEREGLLTAAALIERLEGTDATGLERERTSVQNILHRWSDYATRRRALDLVDLRFINQMAKSFEGNCQPHTASIAYEHFLNTFARHDNNEQNANGSEDNKSPQVAPTQNPKIEVQPESQASYQQLETIFEGTIRRLRLVGNSMSLAGKTFEGEDFVLDDYRGKVVLVDYWATWCGPCVAEYSQIRALWETYHAQGFEVVGVSMDADRESLATYIQERKVPWVILNDQQAGGKHPSTEYYSIQTVPAMFLIGRDGKVLTTQVEVPKLEPLLQEALAQPAK